MSTYSPRVAAVIRQLPQFELSEVADLFFVLVDLLRPATPEVLALVEAERARQEALAAIRTVADDRQLDDAIVLTAKQFDAHNARGNWNSSRIIRLFGTWNEATRRAAGKAGELTAQQVAHLRAARKGVHRERDDYLNCVRKWLDTKPPSRTTDDYDRWHLEYNAQRRPGELPVVSYSMLRKALPWAWETIKQKAGDATARPEARRSRPATSDARHGPHDLVAFGDIKALLGLSTTAARNRTYDDDFPPPAYTQTRNPHTRLWRRSDIDAHLGGRPVPDRLPNDLQDTYMDAHAVADALGLARLTVTTRSSPRVPRPAVLLAGIQLWLRADIEVGNK